MNATVKEGFETGGAAISDSASLPLQCQFQDTGTPSTTEFTNGNNGPGTDTYSPNQQVCVRVTDGDQNLNPAVAETVTAVITSSERRQREHHADGNRAEHRHLHQLHQRQQHDVEREQQRHALRAAGVYTQRHLYGSE